MALLAYLPAPWGELVWDDQTSLGTQVFAFHSLRDVFDPPPGIPYWTYTYYRPLVILTYLLDLALYGPGAAAGPHLTSVLLFLATVALVHALARRLFAGREHGGLAAALAATVFAVHPIHTESVSWITGRSDVLATGFVLASLLAALAFRDRASRAGLLLAPVAFLAGLLSKESAATALALVPLALLLIPAAPVAGGAPAPGRTALAVLAAAYALALAAYLGLRSAGGVAGNPLQVRAPGELLARGLEALAFYLRKLVFPWPQSNILSWDAVPGTGMALLIVALALVATALAAWRWRRGDAAPLLAVAWIWITLSVPLWTAIGAVSKTELAERQLFLPSVGYALALGAAWLLAGSPSGRRLATGLAAIVVLAYGAGTIQRGLVWQDDKSLWQSAVEASPAEPLAWSNLGMARLRAAEEPAAAEAFVRALALARDDDTKFRANQYLGFIELHQGRYEPAARWFGEAINLNPQAPEPWYGLGVAYAKAAGLLGGSAAPDPELGLRAVAQLRGAVSRRSGYIPARLALATVLADLGDRLAATGDSAGAAGRYREAAAELAAIDARIPAPKRAEADAFLRKESGLGLAELRARLASRDGDPG